jgi:hypothetical protein
MQLSSDSQSVPMATTKKEEKIFQVERARY